MTLRFTDDMNDLGQVYVGELLSQQAPIRDSVAVDLFGPRMIDTPDGPIPWIPPEFRTANSGDQYVGKIGLSEPAPSIQIDLDHVDIETQGKFSRKAIISRHADEVLDAIDTAMGLTGYLGSIVKGFNNVAIEQAVSTILKDPLKNATQSTQSAWTSASSAEPFDDIENCMDIVTSVGETPDTMIMGLDYARLLSRTGAIKGAAGRSIDTTGDAVSHEAVREMLVRRFGFSNILIDNSVYQNDANKESTPDINRVYDGTLWIGASEHMIVRDKEDMRESDAGYDSDSQNYWTLQHQLVDFYRGINDAGVILTNVT